MSLADNKKNTLNTIGAFSSLKEEQKLPDPTNTFKSVSSKKNDIVPYLIDVLKTVAGSYALKVLVGNLFTTFIDNSEANIKKSLKKQFIQYNANEPIPNTFKNNGIELPVKNIDSQSKFKVDPNTQNGGLLYNKQTPNFDLSMRNAIVNDGTDTSFSVVSMRYNKNTDTVRFRPDLTNLQDDSVGGWFNQFIDEATFIDKKEIMTQVMDTIYGTITSSENKTQEQVTDELKLKKSLEKLMNDEDPNSFTTEELDDIRKKAQELVDGVVSYDLSCGLVNVSLSPDDLSELIESISGSTDGFVVSNAIENSISKSAANTNTSDIISQNEDSVKDSFFQRIIEIFTLGIIQTITTSPQVQMLLSISKIFQGGELIGGVKNSLDSYKVLIKCLIRDLIAMIAEFIFKLAVNYLVSLLKPIIVKITREKIQQFVRVLKSLVSK